MASHSLSITLNKGPSWDVFGAICYARYNKVPEQSCYEVADDTTVVGFISYNDESDKREELEKLEDLCKASLSITVG